MRDRSPCIACKNRSPGCQSRCEIGKAYWKRQQEINEQIRRERDKERSYNEYKGERVFATKKRYGMIE